MPRTATALTVDRDGLLDVVRPRHKVLDVPEAVEPVVEYYRSIAGEHPDWDDHRAAMLRQGTSLLRLTIETWEPVATGGFPPEVAGG